MFFKINGKGRQLSLQCKHVLEWILKCRSREHIGQSTYLDCLALVDFNYVETKTIDSFPWCHKDRLQCEKIAHINQDLQIKTINNGKLL